MGAFPAFAKVSAVGKRLIIAEKPSVALDIAGVLPGAFEKHEGYLEGAGAVITYAVGHLVELIEPDGYDEKYKKWRMVDLPIIPEEFRLQPRDPKSKKQLSVIHKLIKRADVDEIVNACDAGREGELIFAYIYETAGVQKPVQRLWISSMTKQAITEGFEKLRPGETMRPLESAARSRSEADWLIGMNATRAATIRGRAWVGGVVSLGRVQTPTLALIVKRERAIQQFVPEPFWLVRAGFEPRYGGMWFDVEAAENDTWVRTGERAEEIVARVTGQAGEVTKVERKEQNESAPLLYDLTSLQRDANGRYGFSARRTLQAAQSLYEDKKALTYPRTNSRYLSGDMVSLLKPTAATLLPHGEYAAGARFVVALASLPLGRVINDAKVEDHHAIIPTDVDHHLSAFSLDEKRIFDLVARRFLAVFHPPAKYAKTEVVTEVEGERFRTRGKITLDPGWRAVYGLEADADKAPADDEGDGAGTELPNLEVGQQVLCASAELEAKHTRPPARYTEATLLSAMEGAGKLVEEEELREALKAHGLGTPATRAETIETLIRREYIERVGKDLQATPKGIQVITMLDEHPLTSPELTGEWEKRLGDIERGEGSSEEFMRGIAELTRTTVEHLAALDKEKLRPERAELGLCPRCGATSGEILRENSKAYGCTSWKSREEAGCGFVIWKRVAGRTLTPEVARQLIEEGRTRDVLTGFKSKAKKPFRARLILNAEGKVEFELPPRRPGKPGEADGDEAEGENDGGETATAAAGVATAAE